MRFHLAISLILLGAFPLLAQNSSVPATLASVTSELDSLLTDLEANQTRTLELQAKLSELEALSATHLAALNEQGQQLAAYEQSVHALEAHDRQTLELLSTERVFSSWLVPVAVSASALAALEAVLLLVVVSR
ncbi:MAG: hypothetical protein WCG80_18605 [Spirochaetales bacterium]